MSRSTSGGSQSGNGSALRRSRWSDGWTRRSWKRSLFGMTSAQSQSRVGRGRRGARCGKGRRPRLSWGPQSRARRSKTMLQADDEVAFPLSA